jgi:SAM-dependent methyltransferase
MSLIDRERDLEVLTYTAAVERIAACLGEHVEQVPGRMKILEAGCGRRWEIDLDPTDYELTGVDLDRQALDLRKSVMGDLDLAVVGDISDRDVVPSNHFDVIYSSYVLEHIEVATTALDNFLEWARPGGLIVMLLPNRDSVYCWAARLTPYRLHEWVYRYVFRVRHAGKLIRPYPTYHDPVLAPQSLAAFFRSQGLLVQEWFAIDTFSQRPGLKFAAIRMGMRLISRLSGGRLSDRAVDLGIVMRVPLS